IFISAGTGAGGSSLWFPWPNISSDSTGLLTASTGVSVPVGGTLQGPLTTSTFATLPSAASSAGLRYRVTDVGNAVLWSDGTRWRAENPIVFDRQNGSVASPLATLTGVTSGTFAPSTAVKAIPAGLLTVGSTIEVRSFVTHTGAAGTWTSRATIGSTGNANSDANLQVVGSIAAANGYRTHVEAFVATSTSFTTTSSVPNSSATNASFFDATTNFNVASAMTPAFGISAAN